MNQGPDYGSQSTSMAVPAEHIVHPSLAEGMESLGPWRQCTRSYIQSFQAEGTA